MGLLSNKSMTTRSESQVLLKLVHPGGFVEIHANPVMASEVMKKNPRHYVTRPDIFRFPWIVVSPESILTPGNVFFIVPCHTIRHLLNSSSNTLKHNRDRSRRISQSNKIQCFQKQSSVSTSTSCLKLRTPQENQKPRNGGNKAHSFVRERPVYSSKYTSRDAGKVRPSELHHYSEQIPKLKSCLKKDKIQNARSRDLKVTFACIDKDIDTTKICDP